MKTKLKLKAAKRQIIKITGKIMVQTVVPGHQSIIYSQWFFFATHHN